MNTLYKADQMGVNRLAAVRMRSRFLLESVEVYEQMKDKDIADIWILECLDEIISLHGKVLATHKSPDSITDTDIQIAKEYPIEEVIEFHHGKAIAFCHDDKTPSLVKRKNRAICYPCNKSFNAIDVLIYRDGLSFIEAVKRLR